MGNVEEHLLEIEALKQKNDESITEENALRDLLQKENEAKKSEIATLAEAKLQSETLQKQYDDLKSEHAALRAGAQELASTAEVKTELSEHVAKEKFMDCA